MIASWFRIEPSGSFSRIIICCRNARLSKTLLPTLAEQGTTPAVETRQRLVGRAVEGLRIAGGLSGGERQRAAGAILGPTLLLAMSRPAISTPNRRRPSPMSSRTRSPARGDSALGLHNAELARRCRGFSSADGHLVERARRRPGHDLGRLLRIWFIAEPTSRFCSVASSPPFLLAPPLSAIRCEVYAHDIERLGGVTMP